MVILWLDYKRRNSRIQKMWEDVGGKKIMVTYGPAKGITCSATPKELVDARFILARDAERRLKAEGYKVRETNGNTPDDETEEERLLTEVIGSHTIVEQPTVDQIVKEFKSRFGDTKKDVLSDDALDKVVDKLLTDDDATIALKKLGYKPAEIKKAITKVMESADGQLTSAEIVTRALPLLNN